MAIYLDWNATAPLCDEARAAMAAALDEWGNPSSAHAAGRRARDLLERARDEVAALVGARGDEIVFCSGGTEGDNLAVRGAARAARRASGRDRVIASPVEHPAVSSSLDALAGEGFRIERLPVDETGAIDPAELVRRIGEDVALVTVQVANHEIGNLFPVGELASIAREAGALFHADAVQAAGRVALDVASLGVDLLTISAHKLGGPKGIGAIYERRGCSVEPLVVGGHQERERRPGTENLAGAVGFAAACAVSRREIADRAPRVARLRDRLEAGALAIDGARRFGGGARVCNTASVGFAGVDGELLMASLDLEGVCVSTGAACTSGSLAPSPVILALGVPRETAKTAVRFSLGPSTTGDEIDRVLALLPPLVERIRRA